MSDNHLLETIYNILLNLPEKQQYNLPVNFNNIYEYVNCMRNILDFRFVSLQKEECDNTIKCIIKNGSLHIDAVDNIFFTYNLFKIDEKFYIITKSFKKNNVEILETYPKIIIDLFDEQNIDVINYGYVGNIIMEYKALLNYLDNPFELPLLDSIINPNTYQANGVYRQHNDEQLRHTSLLKNNIELIIGPPGTGKTHIIYNIIDTKIPHDKSNHDILCTTIQNKTIDTIVDKLTKNGAKHKFLVIGNIERLGELAKKYTLFELVNKNNKVITARKEYFDIKYKKKIDNVTIKQKKDYYIYIKNRVMYDIIKDTRIFLSTIAQSYKILEIKKINIRTIIIDEASMVSDTSFMLLANLRPSNLILVGDNKQLGVHGALCEQSILERILKSGYKYKMLTVQFRLPPDQCRLISALYYNNRLRSNKDNDRNTIEWIDISGTQLSINNSYYNMEEINEIIKIYTEYRSTNPDKTIIITSPYMQQVKCLKEHINYVVDDLLHIGTIDSIQGSEAAFVIISLVRTDGIGFVYHDKRICVMLSRSNEKLTIVGSKETFRKSNNKSWNYILNFIENIYV